MMLSSVDLPQPEGPTMATNSPSPTLMLISSITTKGAASPGDGNRFVSFSTAMMVGALAVFAARACSWSGSKLRPPGKAAGRPEAEEQEVDQHHYRHEAHTPGEHHVDARILEPIHQLLADAAADAESLGDERNLPRQRQRDAQGREDERHELRQQHLAQHERAPGAIDRSHLHEALLDGFRTLPDV